VRETPILLSPLKRTNHNYWSSGDTLSRLLLNFALEYAIRKVQVNQVGLDFNGIHQLLTYTAHVNLLGDNADVMKKNTETLINVIKGGGLEGNAHILMYRHQNE
jgi:hypothetical protein